MHPHGAGRGPELFKGSKYLYSTYRWIATFAWSADCPLQNGNYGVVLGVVMRGGFDLSLGMFVVVLYDTYMDTNAVEVI